MGCIQCNKTNIFAYVAFVSDRCRSVDFILINTDICVWAGIYFQRSRSISLIYISWGISRVQENS